METLEVSMPNKVQTGEKPENGIKGLKHWKNDLFAGLLVAMISTPFSIGIAIASGADPICGLTSAIVAGFVLPFIGGSFVTISGPAAGLAPALYLGMLTLGHGNLKAGYPLLLVVIFAAGILQIILSAFKLAKFSAIFPAPVVQGMLTAIGIMIIAKQFPMFIGHPYHAHEFWGIIFETPSEFLQMNTTVFLLGTLTLTLIILMSFFGKNTKLFKVIPPQIIAVLLSTMIAVQLKLDPKYLIHIPDNPLKHGITFPHFSGMFADHTLWMNALIIMITLTLIDGIESLATINAIDKIDPFRRKSNPNKTLFAMGVSNICSSLVGGLTIIPGGVKSTTSISAGGRTQWANFYNAMFLLTFLLVFRHWINLMPQTVLSAVLIYTGYKLCKPNVWIRMAKIGVDQFIVFIFTVFLTLSTDLLWGIIGGVTLKLMLNSWFLWSIEQRICKLNHLYKEDPKKESFFQIVLNMFKSPVEKKEIRDDSLNIYFNKPLVCFNALQVSNELSQIPKEIKNIYLHLTNGVKLIDHTSCEHLQNFVKDTNMSGNFKVAIIGIQNMKMVSMHEGCTRLMQLTESSMSETG